MNRALRTSGAPEIYCEIVEDVYTNSTFKVRLGHRESKVISRNRGIIQGCPWSVYGFELGIDILLRWVQMPFSHDYVPNPLQAYVDDIMMCSRLPDDMIVMVNKLDKFCNWVQIDVKQSKSAFLYERRSGNNWYTRNPDRTEIKLQGKSIEKYPRNKSYKYLGYYFNMVGDWSEQIQDVQTKFKDLMKKLDICPLPSCFKIQAINILCIPTIESVFGIVPIPMKYLQEIEDQIVIYVRQWLNQATNSNRKYVFIPKSKGGLGIRKPSTIYVAKKLATYIVMLNSKDDVVQKAARRSFDLHMSKRKVQMSNGENESFGRYEVNESGLVVKHTKQCLSKSSWIELNEICAKLGVQLVQIGDNYGLKIGNETIYAFQQVYQRIVKSLTEKELEQWKEMESQGRLADLQHANYKCSMEHLKNGKLSDKLVQFVIKGRLQITETNVLLAKMYPDSYGKRCKICKNPHDTISHVLNGCMEFRANYSKRHNRVVDLVCETIEKYNPTLNMYRERIVTANLVKGDDDEIQLIDYFQQVQARKPDMLLFDHLNKKCYIIEVSVPFDAFIDKCYETKFQKYVPLYELLALSGFDTKIVVLIVGSLGHVHYQFTSGLKMLGIPNSVARSVAKYVSVSAMIGSHIIWRKRGQILDEK